MHIVIVGETKVILNEGMPQYKNIDNRGRLIVEFTVCTSIYTQNNTHLCIMCCTSAGNLICGWQVEVSG